METIYSSFIKNKSRVLFILFAVFIFPNLASSQTFKTQVRFVEPTEQTLNAGLVLTDVQKADFETLVAKIEALNMYSIIKEYSVEKNTGNILLKSLSKAEIRDLESSLKQLNIHTVEFNGKFISSQEIQANYVPVNKTEVKHIDRRK